MLLIDWPAPEVPETLVRAGWVVHVKSGSGPEDFTVRELQADDVVARKTGHPPEHIDLVYVHRPLHELPQAVHLAKRLGARTVWYQSGLRSDGTKDPRGCWLSAEDSERARKCVEDVGLQYLQEPYIADAAG